MAFDLDVRFTCSLLDSGRVTARAANITALAGSVGSLLPGPSLSRWVAVLSLLCWIAECWLAIRVAIDASLLRAFWQGDSEAAGKALDELLVRAGFRKSQQARTFDDRSHGWLGLWRAQIAVCAVQMAILLAALVLRIGNT